MGWIHFLTFPLRKIQDEFVVERGNIYYFLPANIAERKFDPSIIVKEATIDDLNKLKEINPNIPIFKQYIKNNEILVIALINERIVGHCCFVRHVPKKFKGFMNLRPDELWDCDIHILPEYRNKGIYSMIFSFAALQARKQGYTKVFCDILSNNQNSIEINTKKFGFLPLCIYLYIKILFYKHTWTERVSFRNQT